MRWLEAVIPLLAVAVYLISHLISNRQEAAQREQPKRRPASPPAPEMREEGSLHRDRGELDQRIEEARRRRESQDETTPVRRAQLVSATPMEPRRRLQGGLARPTPRRKAPKVEVEAVVIVPAPIRQVAVPIALKAPPPAPSPAQQLLTMLKTPSALATAMLLQEVLGPPVCRRQRRI
jgi:hypothetical protein